MTALSVLFDDRVVVAYTRLYIISVSSVNCVDNASNGRRQSHSMQSPGLSWCPWTRTFSAALQRMAQEDLEPVVKVRGARGGSAPPPCFDLGPPC